MDLIILFKTDKTAHHHAVWSQYPGDRPLLCVRCATMRLYRHNVTTAKLMENAKYGAI